MLIDEAMATSSMLIDEAMATNSMLIDEAMAASRCLLMKQWQPAATEENRIIKKDKNKDV